MWALILGNWKPIAAVALAIAFVSTIFGVGYHYGGLSSRATLEAEKASQAAALAKAWQDRELQVTASQKAYKDEVDELTLQAAAHPAIPARLCLQSAPVYIRTTVPAAPAPDGVVPAQSQPVPPVAGPDIGGPLRRLAILADGIVAACRNP